jgi:hypothetical protein
MHAVDAAQAQAQAQARAGTGTGTGAGQASAMATDLALDGIDEVVTMFFPRQVHRSRIEPLGCSLALVPDDGGVRWVLAGDGSTPSDDLPGAEATLRGPAAVLLGVLWKRLPLATTGVAVEGDPAAAQAVLAARLTP